MIKMIYNTYTQKLATKKWMCQFFCYCDQEKMNFVLIFKAIAARFDWEDKRFLSDKSIEVDAN